MSIQVGTGLGKGNNLVSAARDAILTAKSNLNSEKIDLALVFGSISLSSAGLLKTIGLYLQDVPLIGCSAAAIIADTKIYTQGLGVMLFNFSEGTYFNTALISDIKLKLSLNAGEELGEKLLYGFRDIRRDFGIIFTDGLLEDGSKVLTGLQEKIGTSFPIVGGCASDNLAFKKTFIYYNQDMLNDAACGILWGGKINFGIGVKHGWKPLGKPRIVTKSYANIVEEIDGESAIQIYKNYLASDIENLRKELKRISILYPIGIYLSGEDEYLLRNLLYINDDGSLVFQGDVPQNSQIRLMIGTKESCLEATNQAAEEAKNSLFGHKPDFVLVFDSISRYILLRRDAEKELKIIRSCFGPDVPILGFYTYGEDAPLRAVNYQGRSYLHNQTITILAAGE